MLEVDNIDTYYSQRQVLRQLSLKVPQGKIVAMLGRNGMGKTTIIRSIMGLTPPRDGEIRFNGEVISGLEPYQIARKGIAFVPQGRGIFASLSVKENLTIVEKESESGRGRGWDLERVYSLFPILKDRSHAFANHLSGGEQQMLAIARALMNNPKLLIMDEPSEGLAPKVVNQIAHVISQLKTTITVLLAEQNINMALNLADYVYIISQGSVVYDSPPENLKDKQEIRIQFLGVDSKNSKGEFKVEKLGENQAPHPLFLERMRRLQEATHLQQPDRIPIVLPAGYYLAEVGGITKQEFLENPGKAQELLEKVALELQPDAIGGPFPSNPAPYLALGSRMSKFPGHGLDPNSEFQFIEREFMKAEDYESFLADPADWSIRKYLPRAYSELGGLAMTPPLGIHLSGFYSVLGLSSYAIPPVMNAIKALAKAIEAAGDVVQETAQSIQKMISLGFPPAFMKSAINPLAPYDFMSDTLRGMRGIMLDMFQRPDQLLAAEEKVMQIQLESAIATSKALDIKNCMFFLHRGSDGFMSIPQFEKFYWPQLKQMLLVLIENNIMPCLFYEGTWDQRLEYLAELPKGKTIGWFQNSDIIKVKEIVGDTMCIAGGMPNSLLVAGTVAEVKEHTQMVCEVVGKGGGFIMCSSVGELSRSKPELVKAWVDATREYGKY